MAPPLLLIRHHDGREEERELLEGSWSIGRAKENWLCPLDTTLSRRHAVLRFEAGELFIDGLPTRNGIMVNGQRVDGTLALFPGDQVVLGRTVLHVGVEPTCDDATRCQPTADLTAVDGEHAIVAVSAEMLAALDTARRFASSSMPMLISGESGTGKELVARAIHSWSPRRNGPFVVLDCPSLATGLVESELFGVEAGVATGVTARPGRLEQADGGTLFLDEVGDLSAEAQAKLLRFLQEGTFESVGGRKPISIDVRVLAATNRDLTPEKAGDRFRPDLYYRIAALTVELPPLRLRTDDILPLVDHFLLRGGHTHLHASSDAEQALLAYPFPGNVRELAATVERAALLATGAEIRAAELGLAEGTKAETAPHDPPAQARALLQSVVEGSADFWSDVYRPFLDRDLPRPVVRALVAEGLTQCGGSVRSLADRLRVADRYRKLLDFLRNNRLLP